MTNAKILIVEDARITAEDLRDILSGLGYSVMGIVATGADAIREAGRTRPDLVMMDIHIKGDMDGVEAARAIRERYDIPVVYLTAHADSETLARARMAEPLGYIVKPFQERELEATIEMALHKQHIDLATKRRTERLAAALGAIDNGVITLDKQTNVTFVNPAGEAWTGWKNEDACGKPVTEVFCLAPSSIRALGLRALVEAGPVLFSEPALLTDRAGVERAVGGSVAPIRDHEGNSTGAVIVFGESRRENGAEGGRVSLPSNAGAFEMIVESASMQRVVEFARRVAGTQVSTVLLEGESGTGKDVLARFLHHHSNRRAEPFLAINCAAIPETLLESELFGYEKGAFTDARQQKRGILEMASGGTVFLDEVGEMPLSLQAKLLRVLEEQLFRRLGGLKDIKVDLRIVTATNKDLRRAIQEGRFRLDLYYRLNVIRLTIPPLRDRKEDILPLAQHFLGVFNQRFNREVHCTLSPDAEHALLQHDWPGNVRELRNALERAVVLEDGSVIQPEILALGSDDLSAGPLASLVPHSAPSEISLEDLPLEEAERTLLLHALEKAGWNQTRAARLLNITRDTLRYKMKKYNLKPVEAAN